MADASTSPKNKPEMYSSALAAQPLPAPPALPWVGHLLSIPKSQLTQYLLETSKGFDGVLALDFAGVKVPFVFDPDLVAELSDPQRFEKTVGPPLSTLRRVAGDGLFTARGDEPNWGKAHRILQPAFGQRAMKGYFPLMLEVAHQLSAKWIRGGPQADIAVADDMTRLTLDTISVTGFGYRFDSFASETLHPFLGAMVNVLQEVMQRLTRLPIQNKLMTAGLARMERDTALMHTLVDEVIGARRANPSHRPQRDLLDLMLQARDPITDEGLDDANIRYQVITFLIAGHETTSGLLTFALYQLMRNPEVLAQCYAEVDRVMPAGETPRYEHLAQLDAIDRVLRETLRLWPTAPSYAVSAKQDTVLGGRYHLHKGQRVIVFLPGLHRHPRHWPQPDDFDIERFRPQARAQIHPHAYKPFGSGERACIGQQFALTEAKLALAVILQGFALSDPYDYQLSIKETLTIKPDGFRLRARQRVQRAPANGLNTTAIPRGAAALRAAPTPRSDHPASLQLLSGGDRTAAEPVTARITDAAPAPSAALHAPFLILYGSSVGTCQEVAEQAAAVARAAGFAPRVQGLDDGLAIWPTRGWLVIVTATYNGRAPDNARQIEALLEAATPLAWQAPELRYALLGCGNSQWPAYQAFPKKIDALVAASGAQALIARGEADGNGDFDVAVDEWLDTLSAALAAETSTLEAAHSAHTATPIGAPADGNAGLRVTVSAPSALRAALLPANTRAMRLVETTELVRDATGLWDFSREAPRPATRHLRIALPDDMHYATGDHLAVYPHNDPARVSALIERLDLDPTSVVTLSGDTALSRHLAPGQAIGLTQLLSEFVELQDPASRRDIERLADHTRCPHTRAQLGTWLGDGPQDLEARARLSAEITARRISVLDLLLQWPAIELPLADFLDTCSPMRPRWYSISSSSHASPRELTLTVGWLDAPALSGTGRWHGVASSYLCHAMVGQLIAAQIRTPSPDFAPPADPACPLIMIGPGTGIAPFRGFLAERAWQQAHGITCGAALLFTGARHPRHDALYADELAGWTAQGVVEVVNAYSSLPEHPWRFVQDALWARRAEVWQLLASGARCYLCGDGKAMAPAVREALMRIHREFTGATEPAAQAWLASLTQSGQFRQDVFN